MRMPIRRGRQARAASVALRRVRHAVSIAVARTARRDRATPPSASDRESELGDWRTRPALARGEHRARHSTGAHLIAWSAPPTWTTGQILSAAHLNTNVRDNTNFLHSPPGCLATRSTTQSITNATPAAVSFTGTDVYDSDAMHDPAGAPTLITINTSGMYLFWSAVEFTGNATGLRRGFLQTLSGGVRRTGIGNSRNTGHRPHGRRSIRIDHDWRLPARRD